MYVHKYTHTQDFPKDLIIAIFLEIMKIIDVCFSFLEDL